MRNKNILVARNLIRSLNAEALRNVEVVADLVRAFGIVKRAPAAFGEEAVFRNKRTSEAGLYQVPLQIARALTYLSRFRLDSYLEVGVYQGGNFLFVADYLRRFNPDIKCSGVDLNLRYLNDEVRAIVEAEGRYELSEGSSSDFAGRRFALVFVDGDHSFQWAARDWENVGRHADICMYHDIEEASAPGTVEYWKKLKGSAGDRTIVEFLQPKSSPPLCGIGIIHNKPVEITAEAKP